MSHNSPLRAETRAAQYSGEQNATPSTEKATLNLREEMPETYAFIEACREAFGKESVNPMIKLGMEGAETFHAVENGIEIGTRFSEPNKFVSGDQMAIRDNALPPMPHHNK